MRISVGRTVLSALLIALSLPLMLESSGAAEFKMGVVDSQAVLEKSKGGKKVIETLNEYAMSRQKLLAKDEEDFRSNQKQLQDQAAKMSEAEKKEKTTQLQTKYQGIQKRAQEFQQEIQGKQRELFTDYMKKISAATQTLAEKGGVSLVVEKGNEQAMMKIVVYHKDTIDLTEQVIKELDRLNK